MSKNDKIKVIIVVVLLIVGGIFGASRYKKIEIQKNMAEAMGNLNKREYGRALESFDLVLDKNPDDNEVLKLKGMISTYLDAEECFNKNMYDRAEMLLTEMDKDYLKYGIFKNDVDNLRNKIIEAQNKLAI